MQENQIVDAEFTEIKREETAAFFNPVTYLTNAMLAVGLTDAASKWVDGIDSRAETAESEKDRIFFANRSLRLFLAEVEDRENVTPRMLLADGIDSLKWVALMDQGVIPWLLNQFDKKGKRVVSEAEAAPVQQNVTGFTESLPEDSTSMFDKISTLDAPMIADADHVPIARGETNYIQYNDQLGYIDHPPILTGDAITGTPVIIGMDSADASGDQTAHMPVKWNVPINPDLLTSAVIPSGAGSVDQAAFNAIATGVADIRYTVIDTVSTSAVIPDDVVSTVAVVSEGEDSCCGNCTQAVCRSDSGDA